MKLMLELIDNVVTHAKLVSDDIMNKVVCAPPYRSDDGLGNAYARALRQKDYRIKRGYFSDVMLLGEDDPEKYLFKLYKNKMFVNQENEEKRLHSVRYYFSVFSPFYFHDKASIYIGERVLDDVFGVDNANTIMYKFRTHKKFSEDEFNILNDGLRRMNLENKMSLVYGIAYLYKMMALDESSKGHSSHILPLANENTELKKIAIEWYYNLAGTFMEIEGKTEIASIYARSNMEDDAVDIYKSILDDYSMSYWLIKEIKKKIHYLGYGRRIIEQAQVEYFNGDHIKCLELIDNFRKIGCGRVLYRCFEKSRLLEGMCCKQLFLKNGNKGLKDRANKCFVKRIPSIFDCIKIWRDE